jgi:hypothetical protein
LGAGEFQAVFIPDIILRWRWIHGDILKELLAGRNQKRRMKAVP